MDRIIIHQHKKKSSMDDILKLDEMGVPGVITGKAIYEGTIKLSDLSKLV